MASAEGFVVRQLLGDYDGSEFRPERSPYLIWTFIRPRGA